MVTQTELLWEEFSVPLKKFIKKRVANGQDSEDVLQEVFLKVHQNMHNLMDQDKIHVWIYKIARNTIIDYYRLKDKKIDEVELPEYLENANNEDQSIKTEVAACLTLMVDSLPDNYKQAILLTEFQNLTQKELSETLGISISGAKSRVQRARKMLKERLLGCCHLEFDRLGNVIDYQQKSKCKFC